jgi:SAM-dependent methyltransferase/uncharacterized protein YbaR (Trm112 family)
LTDSALVDRWLVARLACPHDGGAVQAETTTLACTLCGRHYAVVEGIPVMLRDDVLQTHESATASLAQVRAAVESVVVAADDADRIDTPPLAPRTPFHEGGPRFVDAAPIDSFVQLAVGATCGLMYQPLMGRLTSYPIPELRVLAGPGGGRTLLDVGCNWGRWSLAAARAGYVPIGVDPMLGAVRAARRVAGQLGLRCHFIVGDARYLPLRTDVVDVAFSYSVLQHMAKHDVRRALRDIRRVLHVGGTAVVQMPNIRALRSFIVAARRRFRPAAGFEVRYWTTRELRLVFGRLIGPVTITVDGFFSLNPQIVDLPALPLRYGALVRVSDALRRAADRWPLLASVADSLYVTARAE